MDLMAEVVRMTDAGEAGVWVVVTAISGHTPQEVGAKMIVRADGSLLGTIGGGRVEHEVIAEAMACLAQGIPRTVSYNLKAELGMCCGGSMALYLEPIRPPARLVLFGAGHVARATAAFAAQCGFRIAIIDERPDWNSPERFPGADRRLVTHADFLACEPLRSTDYVVIATPNHDWDREILGRAVESAASYVGLIGSTRKVDKTRRMLRQEGVDERALGRAHAPIGLDIFAETPEEIGIAIVGELIRHRRQTASRKETRGTAVASRSRLEEEGAI